MKLTFSETPKTGFFRDDYGPAPAKEILVSITHAQKPSLNAHGC